MKNILIVPSFLADTYSNIENIYVQMSKDLNKDFKFIWLIRNPLSPYERYKNEKNKGRLKKAKYVEELEKLDIPYIEAEIAKYNVLKNYLLFKKIFSQYSIDGVYTHFGFEKYYACFFGKLFRKKVFFNEHMYFGRNKNPILRYLRTVFVNHFSDKIIAVSKFIGNTFVPKKTRVIYNAIPINELVSIDKAKLKNQLKLPEAAKVVLMVAAYRPIKRHDLAFEICRLVLSNSKNVFFIFAGDGELLDYYKDKLLEMPNNENIILTGHINHVDTYYGLADVTMLTSDFEPFGYTIIESMLHEVPVLAFSGTGGPDEIIKNGENGYLIPKNNVQLFADQLMELIDQPNHIIEMGRAARKSVSEGFNYKNWLYQIKKVFYEGFNN